ncbi:MAG TPA: permease-like cell division protein FtsX [Acidimicrobiia bacterium]
MSRVIYMIREALSSLRRNVLIVIGAILAVFISLALAFSALVVNELLNLNIAAWQDGTHVVAFLYDEGQNNVPVGAHEALRQEVETWEEVEPPVRYVSKAEAWLEFQRLFENDPTMLEAIRDPTVLPASIRIELQDIRLHESVRFRLEQQQQVVRQVNTAAESIEQLENLSEVLRTLGLGLAIVLGIAAVVLIANTIQLAIYARREEVSIMRLVGASNWYIRVPFLLEGLIEGVVGAAIAVFAVWVATDNLAKAGDDIQLFRLDISNQWFFRWGLIVLLFGALAGVVGSLLGLSRYLREADGTGPDVPKGF